MATKILLISGKAQSGKDTAADCITARGHLKHNEKRGKALVTTSYVPCKSEKFSFADPLKEFCINVFGLTRQQCYGTNDDKNTPTNIRWGDLPLPTEKILSLISCPDHLSSFMTAREVLEVFGSQICRKMYRDCWAYATKKCATEAKCDLAVIADVRFPNEIDLFLELEPIVVRFTRNLLNRQTESELALDHYDWSKVKNFILIDNINMTVDEKNKKVLEAIVQYL